jgi:hypothetical protein
MVFMKLNKKTTGAAIFAILILLLFFSKTIYTYNMPEVTAARPRRGSLSMLEISSGIASWAETETIYSVSTGVVSNVFINEGDTVEKGQVLFEMDFNIPAAERRLAEIENNIIKLEADIKSLQSRINNIREALAASISEHPTPEQLTGQAGFIAIEINRANILYQNAQFSFELGLQSRNDMLNAENNLKALLYKYEAEADDFEHNIILKQIDLENQKLSRETIREIIRDYRNNTLIRAPEAGIIHELSAERGKLFPENAFLVSIGIGREFIVECSISLDNNFVYPGDKCELSNANHTLQGTVRRVRPSTQGKTVIITVLSDDVSDGETFTIAFEKISTASFTIVPNNTINQDNDGYFLYQIKRRKGIMGEEYYLERINIFIGDSDHQNTIVVRGVTFFEPVVLVSNKILSPGQTVSLKNPEDFFEN